MKVISWSLISSFMDRWTIIPHCPYKLYAIHIGKTHSTVPTEPMLYGSYFETNVIGSTANHEAVLDLPRKALTPKQVRENIIRINEGKEPIEGAKRINHVRIDQQIATAHKLAHSMNINIVENYNTQLRIFKQIPNSDWILRSTLDIFPTSVTYRNEHPVTGSKTNMCIIDLKLTSDIDQRLSTGTIWSIGNTINATQLFLYAYAVKHIDFSLNNKINPNNLLEQVITPFIQDIANSNMLLLIYWVFEYKNPLLRNTMKEFMLDPTKEKEIQELIRKATIELDAMEADGYPTMPSYYVCNDCPVLECPVREDVERL